MTETELIKSVYRILNDPEKTPGVARKEARTLILEYWGGLHSD